MCILGQGTLTPSDCTHACTVHAFPVSHFIYVCTYCTIYIVFVPVYPHTVCMYVCLLYVHMLMHTQVSIGVHMTATCGPVIIAWPLLRGGCVIEVDCNV